MNAFQATIENPTSLSARRNLRDEWKKDAKPQWELLDAFLLEQDAEFSYQEHCVNRRRIRCLIEAHGREWAGKIAEVARTYSYEMGLVSAMTITGANLVEHGASLFATAPIISLGLESPLCLDEVCRMPQLRQIRWLFVDSANEFDDEAAALLARCENLTTIYHGGAGGPKLATRGIAALLRAPWLMHAIAFGLSTRETSFPAERALHVIGHNGQLYIESEDAYPYWEQARQAAMMDDAQVLQWPPYVEMERLCWTA